MRLLSTSARIVAPIYTVPAVYLKRKIAYLSSGPKEIFSLVISPRADERRFNGEAKVRSRSLASVDLAPRIHERKQTYDPLRDFVEATIFICMIMDKCVDCNRATAMWTRDRHVV